MKTQEIQEATQKHKEQHKEHIENKNLYYIDCPFCFPLLEETTPEFKRFWDWIQIEYKTLICTNYTSELFKEILILKKNRTDLSQYESSQKIRKLIQTLTFEELPKGSIETIVNNISKTIDKKNNFEKIEDFESTLISFRETFSQSIINKEETESSESEREYKKLNMSRKGSTSYFNENEDNETDPPRLNLQTNDITRIINALTRMSKPETNTVTPNTFYGREEEDPLEWLKSFNNAALANNWSPERKLEIVPSYLRGQASYWFDEEIKDRVEEWSVEEQENTEQENNDNNNNNNNNEEEPSFEKEFVKKFLTKERKNVWFREIEEIDQETDNVEKYSTRFKKLRNKIDFLKTLPEEYLISKYITGLKTEIAERLMEREINTVTEAIRAAKQIERAQNYKKNRTTYTPITSNTNDTYKNKKNNNEQNNPFLKGYKKPNDDSIEELTKQFGKLNIGLAQIIEQNNSKKDSKNCYTCNKPGHRSKDCFKNQTCKNCNRKGHTEKVCKNTERLNTLDEVSSSDEEETFVTTRSGKKTHVRSESKKENKLKPKIEEDPMDVDDEKIRIRKIKNKNEFEKLEEYDIGKDLMNQKANITFGQLLAESKHKKMLNKYIRNTYDQELKHFSEDYESEEEEIQEYRKKRKTFAAKCVITINGEEIEAIVDTGAARNVISRALKERLGLKIQRSSRTKFKFADGSKASSLGELTVKTQFENKTQLMTMPINLHVLESPEEDLLLGTEWFTKTKAKIDFEKKELTIKNTKGKTMKIPIFVTKKDEQENYRQQYEDEIIESGYDSYESDEE